MKNLINYLFLAGIFSLTSCASTKTTYDYDGAPKNSTSTSGRTNEDIQNDVYNAGKEMPADPQPAAQTSQMTQSTQTSGNVITSTIRVSGAVSVGNSNWNQNQNGNWNTGTNWNQNSGNWNTMPNGGSGGMSGTNLFQNTNWNSGTNGNQNGNWNSAPCPNPTYQNGSSGVSAPRISIGSNTPKQPKN